MIISLWSLAFSLHADNIEGKYYSQLEQLEKEKLDNLSETKQRLANLHQYKTEFNLKELSLYNLIQAHFTIMSGNLNSGIKSLEELSGNTSSSASMRARANAMLGIVYRFKGENVKSFLALDKALNELNKIKNSHHKMSVLANVVTVYRDADLIEFALENARRLSSEANKIKTNKAYCSANLELGAIEAISGNGKLGKQRLLIAEEYCSKIDTPLPLIIVNETLISLDLKEKNIDSAFKRIEKFYPKVIKYGWKVTESAYKSLYASAHLLKGDAEKALPYALSAYEISLEYNDYKRNETATSILARIYDALGDDERALKYYKEYMDKNLKNKVMIRQRKLAFDVARRGKL